MPNATVIFEPPGLATSAVGAVSDLLTAPGEPIDRTTSPCAETNLTLMSGEAT